MKRTSRYTKVNLFAPDPRGNSKFTGVRPRDIPAVEGLAEHLVKTEQRLDRLSNEYYNESRFWYRLGDANPSFLFPGDLVHDSKNVSADPLNRIDMVGRIILIPAAKDNR